VTPSVFGVAVFSQLEDLPIHSQGMRPALHVLVGILGLAFPRLASADTEVLKTSSGSPVHWTRAQISLALQTTAPSRTAPQDAVERAIQRAADTWNAVGSGQPHFYISLGGDADVVIAFCRGRWLGETIDLGRSQFTASLRDGSVSSATVEINECDHSFSSSDTIGADRFNLQSVITHELGHVLGLGHNNDSNAVMHPNGREGAQVRRPNADDQTALALLYFGRFSPDEQVAVERPPATVHAGVAAASNPALPSISKAEAPPPELLSVLSLTAVSGKQVMVYTCEPTVLPPLGSAAKTGRTPSQRIKRRVRTP
jgi:predicted Zn-dependent protease